MVEIIWRKAQTVSFLRGKYSQLSILLLCMSDLEQGDSGSISVLASPPDSLLLWLKCVNNVNWSLQRTDHAVKSVCFIDRN